MAGNASLAETNTHNPVLRSALKWLHQHHSDPSVTLASVAHKFNVSPTHLGRLLRGHTGRKFPEYLRSLRIQLATKLFTRTDQSVKQVAFQVGYLNQSHFARDFRNVIGTTPSRFRNMNSKANVGNLT
jgi:transcriptional regulator GlxA family with amidase domain